MQMQSGEWANARDQLEYIRLSAPRNVAAARLLADVYRQLGDWPALVGLLPALGKLKAFPEDELAAREAEALRHHMEAPALLQGDGTRVDKTYKALPRSRRKDAAAVAGYATQLIRSGEGHRAEAVLRKALNRQWDGELVKLYASLETRNINDQINMLENWGKERQNDPDLMLSMARLYRRDNQLAKARDLLARLVAETSGAEALAELGDVLEQMGEADSALATYRQGVHALLGHDGAESGITAPAVLEAPSAEAERKSTMPVVSDQ